MDLEIPSASPTQAFYEANAAKYSAQTFGLNLAPVLDPFEAMLPREAAILELGSGSGRDTKYFMEHGHMVVAVDNSVGLLEQLKANTGMDGLNMDVRDINFEGIFDAVTDGACLLHLDESDRAKVYAQVTRALKPGGLFFTRGYLGDGYNQRPDGREFWLQNADQLECRVGAASGMVLASAISTSPAPLGGMPVLEAIFRKP